MSNWASFAPTPTELAYAAQIFNSADPQKLGVITGEAAVPLLNGSNLSPDKLGEIWAISDHENNGFLSKKGVAVAVRLIGWAQFGESITDSLLLKPGPLPTITGISAPTSSVPAVRPTSPKPTPPVASTVLPPITPADRAKFLRLYVSCGPSSGLLSGDKARDVFLKSRLPVETLGKIWNLADTHQRGSLDAIDFAIGMHLIQTCMASPSFIIPSALSPNVYEQASGGKRFETIREPAAGSTMPSSPTHVPSNSIGTASSIRQQYTGQPSIASSAPDQSFVSTQPSSAFSSQLSASQAWDVTPAEKLKSDAFFDTLDPQKRGFIEGEVAVPFMLESKLSEQLLAQIWDLADLNNDGKLTRDGFAVAMHLINGKLAGREIPDILPPSLMPPRIRNAVPTKAAAPPNEIQQDLWLLDDDTPPATTLPTSPPTIASPAFTALTPAVLSSSPVSLAPAKQTAARDLLDSEDEEVQKAALPPSSAVIGNTKNQLDSTSQSLNKARMEREQLDYNVTDSAAQLVQLESQLASAKAAYETETRLVKDLRERQLEQAADIRTTRAKLIRAESDVSALRTERAEVEGSVLRDKEEIRSLQRTLKEVSDAAVTAKAELERIKKDARQQKGLLAISRKQLSNAETERETVVKEIVTEKEGLAQAYVEHATVEAEYARLSASAPVSAPAAVDVASSSPLNVAIPETPERVASPVLSTKSTNPFGHLTQGFSSPPTVFPPLGPPAQAEESTLKGAPQAAETDPFSVASNVHESAPRPESALPVESRDSSSELKISVPSAEGSDLHPTSAVEHEAPNSSAEVGHGNGHDELLSKPDLEELEHDLPPLKEIVEDGDSSDDDDIPLGQTTLLRKSSIPAPAFLVNHQTPPLQGGDLTVHDITPLASVTATSAFADAFGTSLPDPSPSAATLAPPPSVPRRLSQSRRGTSPFPFVSTSSSSPSKPVSVGTSLFDNASFTESRFPALDNPMKPLQNPELDAAFWGSNAPPITSAQDGNLARETFAFKSSFDDTFDFNSASAFQAPAVEQSNGNSSGPEPTPNSFGSAIPLTMPSPSTIPRPSNPFPAVPATPEISTPFDAIFNTPPVAQEVGTRPQSSYQPLSFDDAFGSAPALPAFNVSGNQASSTPSDASPSPAPPLPKRPRESPAQQRTAPLLTDSDLHRSTSPRPQSPVFNSKASTASPPLPNRKDSTEPPASASRTSKLSLHFPFGKSKKEKKVVSAAKKSTSMDENISSPQSSSGFARAPSPSVVPVPADAIGTAGPNEDVDAVKTLVGMGFSRDQAVQALERHSYDVPTALNSLLGTV